MDQPHPTVGRIVHYVSRGSADGVFKPKCRAALVTAVGAEVEGAEGPVTDETCNLTVHNPKGDFYDVCDHDEGKRPGTWHWPERA